MSDDEAENDEKVFEVLQSHTGSRRQELIGRIEEAVLGIVRAIARGEQPSFSFDDGRDSGWSSLSANSELQRRLKKLCFSGHQSRQRFATLARVLSHAHSALQSSLERPDGDDEFYCTKRAFFYALKNEDVKRFVRKQNKLEWAINQATLLLDCGPWEIGFISTSKGLVAGDLSLTMGESRVVNYQQRTFGAVPDVLTSVTQIRTGAKFVLVVEKDSAFQKLLREDCPTFNNCILVTGKGYPDIPTRMLVRMLSEEAQLPVYALVDANPYGFEIMCVYRFGTLNNLGYREQLLCPRMRWLGVHQEDLANYYIPRIKMTRKDLKKIDELLDRSYIDEKFSNRLMKMRVGKAEIESINQFVRGKPVKRFLTEVFIPAKICNKEYF